MYRNYSYHPQINNSRFIGPILPFIGGALIGYVAGRPNYIPYYQPYYQPTYYYPYNSYPYYQQTFNLN